MSDPAETAGGSAPGRPKTPRSTIMLRWVVGVVVLAALALLAWYGVIYAASPSVIRTPTHTHYHFRIQLIIGGQRVNFADAKYQTPMGTDICTAALTKQPIHFHDGVDQFAHIHWSGMTGGLLLKNYGLNLVGGLPGVLGYRFDQPLKPVAVPIHGNVLPQPPAGAHYYIYTGDASSYKERNWSDFLHQDLRTFFGAPVTTGNSAGAIMPDMPGMSHGDDPTLVKLNDVVGSVVIFAQTDHPTVAQVKDRFNHLVPLPTSSCSG